MFADSREESTKHRPNDEPPEGTAHFVVYNKGITTSERDEEGRLVTYASGDELPQGLAHKVWEVFSDRIAAFAPHGGRLDQPVGGDADKDTSGLQEWLAARGDDGPPYECETCGEAFMSPSALAGHQASHTGDIEATDAPPSLDGPPYVCESCGLAHDTEAAYHGHQAAHRDDTDPEDADDDGGEAA